MLLAFRHGEVECLLGGDRLAMLVMKCSILLVDVDVPACLRVLVALWRARFFVPLDELV